MAIPNICPFKDGGRCTTDCTLYSRANEQCSFLLIAGLLGRIANKLEDTK